MARVFRKGMRQQHERAIVHTLAALSARHKTYVIAAAFVLATSGCASQNVRPQPTDPASKARTTSSRSLPSNDTTVAPQRSRHSRMGDLASALKTYYQQWKGVPYAYGGRSQSGIDCSSFVRHTFDAVESYELPRTTVEQARIGMSVDRSALETGDLVFFKTGRSSHHVGVYIGSGRFMHASTSEGVTISRLDNVYWRSHYWQSRRIIASSRLN